MTSPYFSIVIPVFNRSRLITRTLRSVLDQTFSAFEVIVVDDGSTDDTVKVVSQIKDRRIQIYSKENEERGASRNFGASKAKGIYINFLDSDDIIYPHYLQTAFDASKRLNEPEVFHIDYEFMDTQGSRIPRGSPLPEVLNDHLLNNSEISVLGVFLKKEIALKHQFLSHRSAIVAEDLYVWLTLATRYRFHHIPKVAAAIVIHDDRSLNNRNPFKFLKSILLLKKALAADKFFITFYSRHRTNYFFSRFFAQVALIFAEERKLRWALRLLKEGLVYSKRLVFYKTFWSTLRRVIINLFT
ncbi:MAG: glycosyltransferase [Cyclobacteriaceae bacterium]|nr:glycosyltransferase [Cyclobacteriaceae bacterium]